MNSILYNRLLLQANEAKEHGMLKLAEVVLDSSELIKEDSYNSYSDLKNSIYNDLWKAATKIVSYYNDESADISKIDQNILIFAEKFVEDFEKLLGKDKEIKGPFEPKVLGEL